MTILWAGLAVGAIYSLVAIGYNLVFSASGTFNFAHAQLMMLGVFLSYWGLAKLHYPAGVVFVIAALAVGLVAIAEERIAIRPVSSDHGKLITTVGFATILVGACQIIWGNQALQVPFITENNGFMFLSGALQPVDVALVACAVLAIIILVIVTRRTLIGLALLAMAEDRESAALRGVNVRMLALGAFAISGVLAGISGPIIGPKTFAVATLGTSLALKGFVAVSLGGAGSYVGGLIGGLVVGIVEAEEGYLFGSTYSNLSVFAVLILVLVIRPQGLFVSYQERRV